jgi:non-heme chloroperoxidase
MADRRTRTGGAWSRPGPLLRQRALSGKVDTHNPDRGPLLILSGEKDHTVPRAISTASFELQTHNSGVTEFREMPNRGHALTIDNGWREVADVALAFLQRFV